MAYFQYAEQNLKLFLFFLQDKIQEHIFWQTIDNQKKRITEEKFGNGAHEMIEHHVTHFLRFYNINKMVFFFRKCKLQQKIAVFWIIM